TGYRRLVSPDHSVHLLDGGRHQRYLHRPPGGLAATRCHRGAEQRRDRQLRPAVPARLAAHVPDHRLRPGYRAEPAERHFARDRLAGHRSGHYRPWTKGCYWIPLIRLFISELSVERSLAFGGHDTQW